MNTRNFTKSLLSGVLVIASLSLPQRAQASWTFDANQCSPLTQHEIQAVAPPAIMIMVDKSGSMSGSKWSAAKTAVDTVTTDMTHSEPDTAEFGLGVYPTATIKMEATSNANPQIMSYLNGESANGSNTPTGSAIKKMYESATIQGTIASGPFYGSIGVYSDETNKSIPDTTRDCRTRILGICIDYDYTCGDWVYSDIFVDKSMSFDQLRMDLSIQHDHGLGDLDIRIHHAGVWAALSPYNSGGSSQGWTNTLISEFSGHNMYGWWRLAISDCGWKDDGQLNRWQLNFLEETELNTQNRATAGILITDGAPNDWTVSNAYIDTVAKACQHRNIAPLYVVGLGSGTDVAFNHVVAAAGGTGTCTNGDPCDNPNNYNTYKGKCSGSFQTANATELANELAGIVNEISCTYPLTVVGGGSVPPADQGCEGYDCVYVALNGGVGQIFHEDSSQSPKGWTWASTTDRKMVKLNSTYCAAVQAGTTNIVETQVACLCSEDFGESCNVLDPEDCECSTGRWACYTGIDVCEPNSANSCPGPLEGEGTSCSNGQEGVCYREGSSYCAADGTVQCSAPYVEPPESPELTCDGLDNDCNGIIDDVAWDDRELCHVDAGRNPNAIQNETNRCMIGMAQCVGGAEVCDPFTAMPEVCNGLDDDCNGRVDNLNNSWNNPAFSDESLFSLDGEFVGAACYERNTCVCLNGPADITDPQYLGDFDNYLDAWYNGNNPTCICGSALSQ